MMLQLMSADCVRPLKRQAILGGVGIDRHVWRTPSNVGMTLHRPGEIEVLTGVNLPMLLKAIQLSGGDLALGDMPER